MEKSSPVYLKFKEKLFGIEDETRRKAVFMALLGQELANAGVALPVVVGGLAVELYTFGKYTSDDIDIKADRLHVFRILDKLGFEQQQPHTWVSKELSIVVDWLGADFEQGRSIPDRILNLHTDSGPIMVLPIEDLILDRLAAAKHWKHKASFIWAKYLYEIAIHSENITIDMELLKKYAQEDDVLDLLEIIVKNTSGHDSGESV